MKPNEQQAAVIRAVMKGDNVIVHGKAGSGKSFTIHALCAELFNNDIGYKIVAPFGVAASNINGSTIHSAFSLYTMSFLHNKAIEQANLKMDDWKGVEVLIIDEMSTLRADVFDYMLSALRKRKIRIALFGDLEQAKPIINSHDAMLFEHFGYDTDKLPYFYASKRMAEYSFVEMSLDTIHRQTEQDFLKALEQVRKKHELCPFFDRFKRKALKPKNESGTIICATNAQVTAHNNAYLRSLEGEEIAQEASYMSENFAKNDYLCEAHIVLKDECQVMMLSNDPQRRFFNGSIGIFHVGTEIVTSNVIGKRTDLPSYAAPINDKEKDYLYYIRVEHFNHCVSINGVSILLLPVLFSKYITNTHVFADGRVEYVSSMIQMPIRVCKALTSHKVQGLQFDTVTVDMTKPIRGENLYVALSRCVHTDGLNILTN